MRKSASFYFFKTKPIILENRDEQWRGVADLLSFATHERLRVEWMLFLLYGGQRECYPHCSAFWHLKEDLLQMVQALQGLKIRCP